MRGVREIADEIHLGAMVFMASEYKRLAIFCLIYIAALCFGLGPDTAISFTLGALCSEQPVISECTRQKANVRTAVAANTKGAAAALNVAFFGGSIMGLTVTSMGLLGIGILYHLWEEQRTVSKQLKALRWAAHRLHFLAAWAAAFLQKALMLARTSLAVEAGIPEDDPRNPL